MHEQKYIFRICGKKNIEKFKKYIDLNQTSRKKDLNNLVNSYKGKPEEKRYSKFGESKNTIINILKEGPATPFIISNKLNRPKSSLKAHLQHLEKTNKIYSIKLKTREKLYHLNT